MPEVAAEKIEEQQAIVVVEDDVALLQLVQKHLRRAGFKTEGFSDWRQALSRIVSSPPFLLLLDYQLSGMTGKEFIEALIQKNSLSPFIIMTGHGNETIAVEMMKIGARDYLVKDAAFLELLPAVVRQTVKNLEMETRLRQSEEEKEKLQEQLRQAQKMEAIGTLAGGIAHDFNNILTPLFGYTDLAMQHIPDDNPAKSMLQEVIKASTRARDLVKQILDFSRKSSRNRFPVQIHLLANEILKLLRASIPATIEIRQNVPANCGYITADPTELHQLIMNLCTNAAQAMEEKGGILEVRLECINLQAEDLSGEPDLKPGPYVMLAVSDTGAGIPVSIRDKIFDPYFTTKADGKGSGMGLAMVQSIVRKNGGLIKVHSQPGHGATFQVFLPQTAETAQADLAIHEAVPRGTGRLLFVDDEETITRMAQSMLEMLGYEVTTHTDSSQALELFLAQPERFDLVMTDQTMPGMTGEQLAREVIRLRPDMPVILCTGYSSKIDEIKAKAIGISAFVMKPFDKQELARIIKELLANKMVLPG